MNKKVLLYFNLLLFCFINISCDFNYKNVIEYKDSDISKKNEREWTILMYMAADNDLEYAAIEDVYEMECSKLNTDKVSVLFLLDRSKAYDTSNNNWTGTRLYELKTGRRAGSKDIISRCLDCEDLGLKASSESDIDIDMSSGYVLSNILSYVQKNYPAENLGLIMWGHGTGWRSEKNNIECYKGFAHDDSSGSYMTLKQLGESIKKGLNVNGKKLDFLGLDTCFGGEIEVFYELRNLTKYAVGTEGLLLMSGWNYKNIFDCFESENNKTSQELIKTVINQFANEYSHSPGASIVGFNMEYMEEYFKAFDYVMKLAANKINSRKCRDEIANILFSKSSTKTISYSYGKENSDVYLDINSLIENIRLLYSFDHELNKSIENFNNIKNKSIIYNWSTDDKECGVGIYYGTLTAGNLISSVHPDYYIKGSNPEQIQFVKDSSGYVPSLKSEESFLSKIFYTSFNQ